MKCKFADVTFNIENKHKYSDSFLKPYETETEEEGILISVPDEETEAAFVKEPSLSRGYHESLCIYRKICDEIPNHGAFMMHSSVLSLDGKAYAFTARSGTGKTTHSVLWRENFGAEIINGDKPIYKCENGVFYAYGTPWCGKEGFNKNTRAPLSGVCFLYQNKENVISRLSAAAVLARIFEQVYLPESREGKERVLALLDKLISSTPFYLLGCDISREAVLLSEKTMREGAIER